jgi:hypothetical protein
MSSEPEFPAELLVYLAKREEQRAQRVTRALNALTERERALVKEAAVMGYVQGAMRGDTPPDSVAVHTVIDACFAFPDLYPTIAALGRKDAAQ